MRVVPDFPVDGHVIYYDKGGMHAIFIAPPVPSTQTVLTQKPTN